MDPESTTMAGLETVLDEDASINSFSPAHQVLSDDYLRTEIFNYVDRNEDRIVPYNPDLCALALVCHSFHEDAMRLLWRAVPIEALLTLMNDGLF